MENYEFIYKNSRGQWDICKNPIFIARHTFCRAIPKDLTDFGFNNIKDLIRWLNEVEGLGLCTDKQARFIKEYIW